MKPNAKTFIEGTAIRITAVVNVDTLTSAHVTVIDPSSKKKVDATDMTRDAAGVYSYIVQTTTDWLEGEYVVRFEMTSGSYTGVTEEKFELVEQEPSNAI